MEVRFGNNAHHLNYLAGPVEVRFGNIAHHLNYLAG